MKTCILKEKSDKRVSITPNDAATLIKLGHEVFFEHQCGYEAGFSDEKYEKAGAILCRSIESLSNVSYT